jgi:hypothetical protein
LITREPAEPVASSGSPECVVIGGEAEPIRQLARDCTSAREQHGAELHESRGVRDAARSIIANGLDAPAIEQRGR